jgi:hypothetical protein
MTPKKWLTPLPPEELLEWVRSDISDRKLRLIVVAWCRRIWDQLTDTGRRAVSLAERFADGDVTSGELRHAGSESAAECNPPFLTSHIEAATGTTTPNLRDQQGWAWALHVAYSGRVLAMLHTPRNGKRRQTIAERSERAHQAKIVRDVVGNPFRPVMPDSRWLSETVVQFATNVYVEKAFDRLPILADALEDEGCDSLDLLHHLRGNGPHVRGCWAIDLLLGKS